MKTSLLIKILAGLTATGAAATGIIVPIVHHKKSEIIFENPEVNEKFNIDIDTVISKPSGIELSYFITGTAHDTVINPGIGEHNGWDLEILVENISSGTDVERIRVPADKMNTGFNNYTLTKDNLTLNPGGEYEIWLEWNDESSPYVNKSTLKRPFTVPYDVPTVKRLEIAPPTEYLDGIRGGDLKLIMDANGTDIADLSTSLNVARISFGIDMPYSDILIDWDRIYDPVEDEIIFWREWNDVKFTPGTIHHGEVTLEYDEVYSGLPSPVVTPVSFSTYDRHHAPTLTVSTDHIYTPGPTNSIDFTSINLNIDITDRVNLPGEHPVNLIGWQEIYQKFNEIEILLSGSSGSVIEHSINRNEIYMLDLADGLLDGKLVKNLTNLEEGEDYLVDLQVKVSNEDYIEQDGGLNGDGKYQTSFKMRELLSPPELKIDKNSMDIHVSDNSASNVEQKSWDLEANVSITNKTIDSNGDQYTVGWDDFTGHSWAIAEEGTQIIKDSGTLLSATDKIISNSTLEPNKKYELWFKATGNSYLDIPASDNKLVVIEKFSTGKKFAPEVDESTIGITPIVGSPGTVDVTFAYMGDGINPYTYGNNVKDIELSEINGNNFSYEESSRVGNGTDEKITITNLDPSTEYKFKMTLFHDENTMENIDGTPFTDVYFDYLAPKQEATAFVSNWTKNSFDISIKEVNEPLRWEYFDAIEIAINNTANFDIGSNQYILRFNAGTTEYEKLKLGGSLTIDSLTNGNITPLWEDMFYKIDVSLILSEGRPKENIIINYQNGDENTQKTEKDLNLNDKTEATISDINTSRIMNVNIDLKNTLGFQNKQIVYTIKKNGTLYTEHTVTYDLDEQYASKRIQKGFLINDGDTLNPADYSVEIRII